MTDPFERTPEGVLVRIRQRLTALEDRLLRILPPRLAADLPSLGSGVDLNNIIETGWYLQNVNGNASTALNYPVARAGHLEVSSGKPGGTVGFVAQTYTDYNNGRQYRRTFYNGTWTAWAQNIDSVADLPVASTTVAGIVRLSTNTETADGTSQTIAVTPNALRVLMLRTNASAPVATSGWSLWGQHTGGTPSGSPYVAIANGYCSVRMVVRNDTGAAATVGSGIIIATGMPAVTVSNFPLQVNVPVSSEPGQNSPDFGAFMAGSTNLKIRGSGGGSVAAGAYFNISGIYPI